MEGKNKKVAVTGANGFLGSFITECLINRGYDVTAVVRKTSDKRWIENLPVKFSYATLEDKESLEKSFKEVEMVVHNAGIVKSQNPFDFFKINTEGTKNVLNAAIKKGISKIVYISSQAAAGPSINKKEKKEEEPENPQSMYGKSKLEAEKILLSKRSKINVVILRPSAVYGPRDREFFSLVKLYYMGIKIYPGKKPFFTSLIYVKDVAQAVEKALSKRIESGKVYFVSDGVVYNLSYIYTLLEEFTAKKALRISLPLPFIPFLASIFFKDSVMTKDKVKDLKFRYWIVSNERARKELEFVPLYTLRKGLKETIRWYKRKGWL